MCDYLLPNWLNPGRAEVRKPSLLPWSVPAIYACILRNSQRARTCTCISRHVYPATRAPGQELLSRDTIFKHNRVRQTTLQLSDGVWKQVCWI